MSTILQKTINKKVNCNGIGLHSGKEVKMTLLPSEENSGIIFRRIDITHKNNQISANYQNVVDTNLGTTIANSDGVNVATIEHLMAAIWGCGIDNLVVELNSAEIPIYLVVELNSAEIPIMDGSSAPFIFLIECAGVHNQETPKRIVEIIKKVSVSDGDKLLSVEPAKEFSIDLQINFDHQQINTQNFNFNSKYNSFKNDISRARTFAFEKDIEKMHKAGLALGGSLKNAVVISKDGVINQDGLRYQDEFVRHKMLDFIGDIFLCNGYIIGHFKGFKIGHNLNNKLLHKIFLDNTSWQLI